MTRVAIAHGDDPRAMVFNVLDLVGAEEVVRTDDAVVLKPNYVEPMRPDAGVTTDPRVIEAVVVWLQSLGVRNITIAEGGASAAGTDRAFALVGLPALADRLGVRLVNAMRDERVEVEVPNALSLHRVHLARTIYEADCLIDLPKLKCHSMAGVTLSIKNLMGAVVPEKTLIHRQLHRRLTDLATIMRPKLCVIDGLVGAERHETAGTPVHHGIIIAGTDPVAVDTVGTMAMGLDPADIEHLRLCADRGLGENRPDHIQLLGVSLDRVRKQYRSW